MNGKDANHMENCLFCKIISGEIPVSYTHLAKWQGALGLGAVCLACAITALIACAFTGGRRYLRWHPVCWMGVGSVSYTHLDVYKRQAVPWAAGCRSAAAWS